MAPQDAVTVQLREERLRSSKLDEVILDREATIMQFRDLVTSLQTYAYFSVVLAVLT